jgi:hypothetical protein
MKNSFSFSDYSALRRCGRYYEKVVIEKLKEPGPEDSNLHFGTALHLGLNASLAAEDAVSQFKTYWEAIREREMTYDRFDWAALQDLGLRFLATFERKYRPIMKPIELETRLYGEYGDLKLEGTPDAIVEYNGKVTLVDFKTSAYNYDKAKIQNAFQLMLYSYLAETTKGHKIEQIMYLVFNKGTGTIQTPLVRKFDNFETILLLSEMNDYININRNSFGRNPNNCIMGKRKCGFFTECWGGQDVEQT